MEIKKLSALGVALAPLTVVYLLPISSKPSCWTTVRRVRLLCLLCPTAERASTSKICSIPARRQLTLGGEVKNGDGIEENDTKAGSSNISTFFPSNVRTILSNLRRFFPRLQSLRIKFKPIDWEDFWNDENFDYSDGETAEQISSAEDDRAWRALMAKTYKLLAQNQQPCIKALEIQALMPKEVSTFSNRAFHDFLGMLERFTLSIYGNQMAPGGTSTPFTAIRPFYLNLTRSSSIICRT